MRSSTGDYLPAWLTAGALCLVAALACLTITKPGNAVVETQPQTALQPAES